MSKGPEPLFLQGAQGQLFVLHLPAEKEHKGTLLFVPPFAEEMNRCRVTVAKQARAFNQLGYSCVLLDPFGTGDSDGELNDASWDGWVSDVCVAADWVKNQTGSNPVLWGARLGALLAAETANRNPDRFSKLLFWQPVQSGKLFLTQYLRLRVANRVDRGLPPETTEDIRNALKSGETMEVAGYLLSHSLTGQLDAAAMTTFGNLQGIDIDWLEHVSESERPLSPASRKTIDSLVQQGCHVREKTFTGPPIWQLHKRDEIPDLISVTSSLWGAIE